MSPRKIAAVLIAVLVLVFVGGNLETARVWLLGARLEMPLGFVILLSAVLGAAGAFLWNLVRGSTGAKS